MGAPTREQVENLKRQWLADGSWDIEDSPGFEDYREELAAFARETGRRRGRERAALLSAKARELGCPGNLELAQYVLGLEARLERIEGILDDRGRWFGGSCG